MSVRWPDLELLRDGRGDLIALSPLSRPAARRAMTDALRKLKPAFASQIRGPSAAVAGTVTAGNASGLNDGAAALVLTSEETAREIDCEVRRIVDEQYERVKRLLAERKAALLEGAKRLLDQEVISGSDLKAIMDKY